MIEKPAEQAAITVAPAYVQAAEESRQAREEFHRQQEAEEAATTPEQEKEQRVAANKQKRIAEIDATLAGLQRRSTKSP